MTNQRACVIGGTIGACLMLFVSCSATPVSTTKTSAVPTLTNAQQQVQQGAQSLQQTTAATKKDAQTGMAQTPAASAQTLDPYWTDILAQMGTQDGIITQLNLTEKNLTDAETLVKATETQRDTALTDLAAAKSDATKALQAKYLGYSGFLFFGALIAVGVCVFLKGNPYAAGVAALLGVGCVVCIFLVQILPIIPYIMIALGLALIGLLIYAIIKNKTAIEAALSNLNIFKKATTQTVSTLEATKQYMTLKGRQAVFGDGAIPGVAHAIQDEETMDVVREMRSKINKAPSVPGRVALDFSGSVSSKSGDTVTQMTYDENGQVPSSATHTIVAPPAAVVADVQPRTNSYTITTTPSRIEILFN
jgi:hypothetical protein